LIHQEVWATEHARKSSKTEQQLMLRKVHRPYFNHRNIFIREKRGKLHVQNLNLLLFLVPF
jgi:hypothetical protein